MTAAVDFHQELRGVWKQRLADANRRAAAAERDRAQAKRELDAIEDDIARMRLALAADLLDGSFIAVAADLAPAPAGFIETGVTCEPVA